jgi:hypothetical protein
MSDDNRNQGPQVDHYTAVISITRTKIVPGKSAFRNAEPPSSERQVYDVSRLTVRASTIDKLVERVTGHLGLIEDDANG